MTIPFNYIKKSKHNKKKYETKEIILHRLFIQVGKRNKNLGQDDIMIMWLSLFSTKSILAPKELKYYFGGILFKQKKFSILVLEILIYNLDGMNLFNQ